MQLFYQPTYANKTLSICQELFQKLGVLAIKNKQPDKQESWSLETHKNIQSQKYILFQPMIGAFKNEEIKQQE